MILVDTSVIIDALRKADPRLQGLLSTYGVAIENDVELWTRDKQFQLVQAALPALKLFQEPP
jgi:predicted nucleic acid-binding protein